MRIFSLRQPRYEIPPAVCFVFRWAGLPIEIAQQLAFEEQYLQFQKYLLLNLQSVLQEKPNWVPMSLSLSLRAGAVKAYVVFAASIVEGALAAWGEKIGLAGQGQLLSKPLGAVLRAWEADDGQPRAEISPIWAQLQLIKTYRNFVHMGRAAADAEAYWVNILAQEVALLSAVDDTLAHLSRNCNGL